MHFSRARHIPLKNTLVEWITEMISPMSMYMVNYLSNCSMNVLQLGHIGRNAFKEIISGKIKLTPFLF